MVVLAASRQDAACALRSVCGVVIAVVRYILGIGEDLLQGIQVASNFLCWCLKA